MKNAAANIRAAKIRAARVETDLPAIVRQINAYERYPVTVERVRGWFEYYAAPAFHTRRLVAVDENDAPVGYSQVVHEPAAPEHDFEVWLVAEPGLRGQGIGAALWEASLDYLRAQGAERLSSEVLDDDPLSLAFARRRGFEIDQHVFGSTLDLSTFDETPYLPALAALEAGGIRFCTLADFPDTPQTRRRLFDLNGANCLDIPGAVSLPWTFSQFEHMMQSDWFRREGQLLAVDGEQWVGLAAVRLIPENQEAYNEHTGVLRAYRGRKIAQALKVLAARYARQNGARQIRTDNHSANAPILAINRKMGYRPRPGKYLLAGRLAGAGS